MGAASLLTCALNHAGMQRDEASDGWYYVFAIERGKPGITYHQDTGINSAVHTQATPEQPGLLLSDVPRPGALS